MKSIYFGRKIEKNTKVWLSNNQVSFHEENLIDIQFNQPATAFFQKISDSKKQWMITSQWSAKWMLLHYKEAGFKSDDSIFCISEKQAKIVNQISENIFVAEFSNSESVSKLIQKKNKGELIIYLKGNRSIRLFEAHFSNLDFNFYEFQVYRNKLLNSKVENQFGVYLFFSPSGIESFKNGGNVLHEKSVLITIGETTGQKAKASFYNQVFISPEPNEMAMVKLAKSVLIDREENFISS